MWEEPAPDLPATRAQRCIGGRRPKLPPEQWAQAGCLIGAVVPRQQVAIIYDVGLSCTENSRPQNWLKYAHMTTQSENLQNP
ncbi:hypothetical protein LQG32_002754 [Salmonella enterica]|nr:hypothetical protein [Salmonella enterica]